MSWFLEFCNSVNLLQCESLLAKACSHKHSSQKISDNVISSTNFNAHFNINMYVTLLSSTCFGP